MEGRFTSIKQEMPILSSAERQRIKDEISSLKNRRLTLKDAIRSHYQSGGQQGGFQVRGAETELAQVERRISELDERLKGVVS
jgi:transcription elongation GreA/GreB family factor